MSQRLCGIRYATVEDGAVLHLACQYLAEHPSDRHSWYAVQQEDIHRAELGRLVGTPATAPPAVQVIALDVATGLHDEWLEFLLSALHDRKRARRGVAGFR